MCIRDRICSKCVKGFDKSMEEKPKQRKRAAPNTASTEHTRFKMIRKSTMIDDDVVVDMEEVHTL